MSDQIQQSPASAQPAAKTDRPVFVIFGYEYREDSGGGIVLHKLCDLINRLGYQAYIWPRRRLPKQGTPWLLWLYREFKHWQRGVTVNPDFITPLANDSHLENCIVVYPEIVQGNPLRAKRVVRWLLHQPGFLSAGQSQYGKDDLFFYYLKAFDNPALNKYPDNELRILHFMTSIYRQTNTGERSGTCYLVRKGKNRFPNDGRHANDIQVDNLGHQERAEVFNRCKTFVSYDAHTMLSKYAALCGCQSIVIPLPNTPASEWLPNEADRYGIAYGHDDIERAKETLPLLKSHMENIEKRSAESVKTFIDKTLAYFNIS